MIQPWLGERSASRHPGVWGQHHPTRVTPTVCIYRFIVNVCLLTLLRCSWAVIATAMDSASAGSGQLSFVTDIKPAGPLEARAQGSGREALLFQVQLRFLQGVTLEMFCSFQFVFLPVFVLLLLRKASDLLLHTPHSCGAVQMLRWSKGAQQPGSAAMERTQLLLRSPRNPGRCGLGHCIFSPTKQGAFCCEPQNPLGQQHHAKQECWVSQGGSHPRSPSTEPAVSTNQNQWRAVRALFWYHAHVACSELPRLLAVVSQARANWISCAVVKDWLSPPRQAPAALPWPCVACAPGRTHFLPWRPSRPAAGVQGAVVFMSPTTPHYGHLPEACIPGLLESLHPLVCQLCTTAGPYTRQIERHGAAGCQEPGTWSH